MNVPRSVSRELRRLLRPLPLGVALMASTPGAGLAASAGPTLRTTRSREARTTAICCDWTLRTPSV
jgi:hypothetical protein